jgi:heavy-metal-associated domain-containing protein
MATRMRQGSRRQQGTEARADVRHGRIVSHAPGRVRVRLQREHRDPDVLTEIEERLGARNGVSSVSADTRTGSVLVHYDRQALSRENLVEMLFDVGVVVRELLGADEVPDDLGRGDASPGVVQHSEGATSILDAVTDLDRRISELTGGRIDLKLLVPAGIGLIALRQVAINGLGLTQVPGYVLLWYTFDSFYKLHQRKTAALVEKAAEQVLHADPGMEAVAVSEIKASGS